MALVKAWQCEYCGMLSPSDNGDKDPPEGWLRIYWHKIPPEGQPSQNAEHNQTVCSGRCASKSFLAADAAPKRHRRKAAAPVKAETVFQCPECDRSYERPQHLGNHRKRIHGVESERDRLSRRG